MEKILRAEAKTRTQNNFEIMQEQDFTILTQRIWSHIESRIVKGKFKTEIISVKGYSEVVLKRAIKYFEELGYNYEYEHADHSGIIFYWD